MLERSRQFTRGGVHVFETRLPTPIRLAGVLCIAVVVWGIASALGPAPTGDQFNSTVIIPADRTDSTLFDQLPAAVMFLAFAALGLYLAFGSKTVTVDPGTRRLRYAIVLIRQWQRLDEELSEPLVIVTEYAQQGGVWLVRLSGHGPPLGMFAGRPAADVFAREAAKRLASDFEAVLDSN